MKYQQPVVMPASVQDWLDHELEVRGIDAVVYTRYILSILQQDNELMDTELFSGVAKRNPQVMESPGGKEKSKLSADRSKLLNCEEMKKSAAIECLMSVSEQKCGIEKLVDELCEKLKNIQGNGCGSDLEVKGGTRSNTIDICSLTSSSPTEDAGICCPAFSGASGNVEPSAEPKGQNFENITQWINVLESNKEQETVEKQLSEEEDKMQNDRNEVNEDKIKEKEDEKLNFIPGYSPFNLINPKMGDFVIDNWPQLHPEKITAPWYMEEKCFTEIQPIGYNINNNNVYKYGKPEITRNEESSMESSVVDVASGNGREKYNERDYIVNNNSTENLQEEENLLAIEEVAEAMGEAELLAKLAAKFNDIASIWSDQREQQLDDHGKVGNNIWQVLPFYRPDDKNLSSVSLGPQMAANTDRKFDWPHVLARTTSYTDDNRADLIKQLGDETVENAKSLFISASKPSEINSKQSNCQQWNRSLYSSFANLEIDCSSPQEKDLKAEQETLEPCSPVRREEEMQLIWQMLGNALHSEQASCINNDEELGFLESYQRYSKVDDTFNNDWQGLKSNNTDLTPYSCPIEDKPFDLQAVWDSSALQREVDSLPYVPFGSSSESLVGNDYWQSSETSVDSVMPLTRSYDSYLNKIYPSEVQECAIPESEALSEPTLSPKNCTLTYHKGESCFVEVKPSCRNNWGNSNAQVPLQKQFSIQMPQTDYDTEDTSENLLTSPKTHFRPIRQDSCETDTTGSSDDSALAVSQNIEDQLAAINCKSISPIFLNCRPPDEESSDESNFIPHISKSNLEKFCQTEDILTLMPGQSDAMDDESSKPLTTSVTGEDSCTQMLNAVIDVLDNMLNERAGSDGEEITNTTTDSSSSSSVSPPSSRDDSSEMLPRVPVELPYNNPMYSNKTGLWDGSCPMVKWSTAQEENEEQGSWDETTNQASWAECVQVEAKEMDKIKALRDEIRDEEEKLFDDINYLRVLNLEDEYENQVCPIGQEQWIGSEELLPKTPEDTPEEEECNLELERIHCSGRTYSSSDGDDIACPDGIAYPEYFGDMQPQDPFASSKLPLLSSSKVLYSTDLEEEWKKDLFDAQIPKSRTKQKSGNVKRPCSFYMEGNCRRTDCKFSHDLASITCRFWVEGSCFKGVTCPFLHGFQKDKEDNDEKADFTLELQSEAHFPALSKPKACPRKKDFVQSSSSDSTPVAKSKRQRKRFSGKERPSSPNSALKQCKSSRSQKSKQRNSKSSSSEDDVMEV